METCRRCDRMIVFDDPWSFLHFALGIATKIAALMGMAWLSIPIFVAFTVWETIEQEGTHWKLGDYIEYLLGYTLADIATKS